MLIPLILQESRWFHQEVVLQIIAEHIKWKLIVYQRSCLTKYTVQTSLILLSFLIVLLKRLNLIDKSKEEFQVTSSERVVAENWYAIIYSSKRSKVLVLILYLMSFGTHPLPFYDSIKETTNSRNIEMYQNTWKFTTQTFMELQWENNPLYISNPCLWKFPSFKVLLCLISIKKKRDCYGFL